MFISGERADKVNRIAPALTTPSYYCLSRYLSQFCDGNAFDAPRQYPGRVELVSTSVSRSLIQYRMSFMRFLFKERMYDRAENLPAGTKLADALFLQRDLGEYIGYRRGSNVVLIEKVWSLISSSRLVGLLGLGRFLRFIRGSTGSTRGWPLLRGPRRPFGRLVGSSGRCVSLLGSTRLTGCRLRFSARRRVIPRLLRRLRSNFGRSAGQLTSRYAK